MPDERLYLVRVLATGGAKSIQTQCLRVKTKEAACNINRLVSA